MIHFHVEPSYLHEQSMSIELIDRIKSLSCWSGRVDPIPVTGGITNFNFKVRDGDSSFFVRTGVDIPIHGVMRFNEMAAAKAAEQVGLSPAILYSEPGLMVCRYIDGHTLSEQDVRIQSNLEQIINLIKRCHREIPRYFRGPALIFWVFHVIRNYIGELEERESTYLNILPELSNKAELLEAALGPTRIVFGHNDLLPANFIDDGTRMWLIDWDYAGYNTPLFDLANLASNNSLDRGQETWLLENYFETKLTVTLARSFSAMKCASLLRETLWSMVSEIHSTLDFDYAEYTAQNMGHFNSAYNEGQEMFSHA